MQPMAFMNITQPPTMLVCVLAFNISVAEQAIASKFLIEFNTFMRIQFKIEFIVNFVEFVFIQLTILEMGSFAYGNANKQKWYTRGFTRRFLKCCKLLSHICIQNAMAVVMSQSSIHIDSLYTFWGASNMTLVYRISCVSSFVHMIKAIVNSICTQIFDKTYTHRQCSLFNECDC